MVGDDVALMDHLVKDGSICNWYANHQTNPIWMFSIWDFQSDSSPQTLAQTKHNWLPHFCDKVNSLVNGKSKVKLHIPIMAAMYGWNDRLVVATNTNCGTWAMYHLTERATSCSAQLSSRCCRMCSSGYSTSINFWE